MKEVRAKKALGQHFLNDPAIAARIAAAIAGPSLPEAARRWSDIPVLEVGPGMGILSAFLLDSGRQVKAVEIDSESVGYLHRCLPALDVVEGDFLEMDLSTLFPGEFALIGNYPYNISSQIFFKALDYRERIPVIAGMLQKEVAERICAAPGGRVRGILSVLLQAWYDCEYLFDVAPGKFTPPPKVTSGVLRLTRNSRTELGCDGRLFRTVVKTAFGQRRKTIRNSLGSFNLDPSRLADPEMLQLRPERLTVEQFIELTNAVAASKA